MILRIDRIFHDESVAGALKMTDMNLQDMKMTDQYAGHENGGHEIARQETSSEAANVWGWIDWIFMSWNFMSCIFMRCTLVRQFHVMQFYVLQFWWSVIFMSVIFSQIRNSYGGSLWKLTVRKSYLTSYLWFTVTVSPSCTVSETLPFICELILDADWPKKPTTSLLPTEWLCRWMLLLSKRCESLDSLLRMVYNISMKWPLKMVPYSVEKIVSGHFPTTAWGLFRPATWLRLAAPIVDTAEPLTGRPGPMSCLLAQVGPNWASELCDCHQRQTMGHIVDSCPLTRNSMVVWQDSTRLMMTQLTGWKPRLQ